MNANGKKNGKTNSSNSICLNCQLNGDQRKVVKKLPYKFSYRFFTEGDKEPRKMMIEDWEIGALFWNCLYQTDGDEEAAS